MSAVLCVDCFRVVERPREVYARPTCYRCLPPPPPLPEYGCACTACKTLKRYQAERVFARQRDAREHPAQVLSNAPSDLPRKQIDDPSLEANGRPQGGSKATDGNKG